MEAGAVSGAFCSGDAVGVLLGLGAVSALVLMLLPLCAGTGVDCDSGVEGARAGMGVAVGSGDGVAFGVGDSKASERLFGVALGFTTLPGDFLELALGTD